MSFSYFNVIQFFIIFHKLHISKNMGKRSDARNPKTKYMKKTNEIHSQRGNIKNTCYFKSIQCPQTWPQKNSKITYRKIMVGNTVYQIAFIVSAHIKVQLLRKAVFEIHSQVHCQLYEYSISENLSNILIQWN